MDQLDIMFRNPKAWLSTSRVEGKIRNPKSAIRNFDLFIAHQR